MLNERTLDDLRTQEALDMIMMILRDADLAGAVCVVNEHEMGCAYHLATTFNSVIEDETAPMGVRAFRRATDAAEHIPALAQRLAVGTSRMLHSLHDFGAQTHRLMADLLALVREDGL